MLEAEGSSGGSSATATSPPSSSQSSANCSLAVTHDLEVAPRTQDWPEMLRASETKFFEEFTSKRYRFRGK